MRPREVATAPKGATHDSVAGNSLLCVNIFRLAFQGDRGREIALLESYHQNPYRALRRPLSGARKRRDCDTGPQNGRVPGSVLRGFLRVKRDDEGCHAK